MTRPDRGRRREPALRGRTAEVVVHIEPGDPLRQFLLSTARPIAVEAIGDIGSPGVEEMRAGGVALLVPMVSQGELVAVLQLGERRSGQPYSVEDRDLLASLASSTAQSIRVSQLVRERESRARERERVAAELRVATLIQQGFLPEMPSLAGWNFETHYEPAREVGGDFIDVIELADERLGVVAGDVTDKGVPASLVMASTRTLVRSLAQQVVEPSVVLRSANDQLHREIPAGMFVTCLYGILDTSSGAFRFANAGHNLPVHRAASGTAEPRATGMPLGLLPGSSYDESAVAVDEGDSITLYSDALPEAHDAGGEMFGFDRVRRAIAGSGAGPIVQPLLEALREFTGPGWEQEDDVSILCIHRGRG